MIEFRLLVDEIDYEALTRYLAPLLAEKVGEKGGLGALLGGRKEPLTKMAVQMVKAMGQEEKDELLLRLISEKGDMLVQQVNKTALKRGVGVHVDSITAQQV